MGIEASITLLELPHQRDKIAMPGKHVNKFRDIARVCGYNGYREKKQQRSPIPKKLIEANAIPESKNGYLVRVFRA